MNIWAQKSPTTKKKRHPPIPPRFERGGSSQGIKILLFIHGCLEKSIPVVSFMVHDLKYFILINKQVPINFTLWCLRSRLQGMVFSCGCLAIMTLYIITDSINSWCERALLINTELINCAACTRSAVQNCLNLCSAIGWKCLICLIPYSFPQNFPSKLMLKREQHFL